MIGFTTSLCGTCARSLAAEIVREDGRAVMVKRCPDHGEQRVTIAADADWYLETIGERAELEAPPDARRPVTQGCPFDCGTCTAHEQRIHLPVVPITSACNLDCPICYTHNKTEGAWHMSEAELGSVLENLRRAAPDRRVINLTGGEPTLHPDIVRLVALCKEAGIARITISTHGLTFLKHEQLLAQLAGLGARIVLSFDSLEDEANRALIGGNVTAPKMRVLELLERYNVQTSLLPVLAKGHNDAEVAALVRLGLAKDFVRTVELHTVTFTGQGGATFDCRARYTPDEVLSDFERQTDGAIRRSDFVPSPAAHPLCFQSAYLLRLDRSGRWLPFTRFMTRAELREMLRGGFYLHPGARTEELLQDLVNRLWAGAIECAERDDVLATMRRLTNEMFTPGLTDDDRVAVAEKSVKLVQVHSYMDAETFDTDRVRQCCVCIPEADGTTVPGCAYITLYKDRDPRFVVRPAAALTTLGRGQLRLPVLA